jgi:AcrR family transcriptional regulator
VPAGRPRANLSTDDIVDMALTLIRERGVEGLSMRQLSGHLGASLGATYRHLPNKDALLEQCGRVLFARSWRPLDEGENPLEWLQEQVLSVYRVLALHRGMASYVVHHIQTAAQEIAEPVLGVLLASGFSEEEAVVVGTVLTLFTAGALLTDFERTVAVDTADPQSLVAAGIAFILSRSGKGTVEGRP